MLPHGPILPDGSSFATRVRLDCNRVSEQHLPEAGRISFRHRSNKGRPGLPYQGLTCMYKPTVFRSIR